MAGIIELKNGDWNVSGKGFRTMVAGVSMHLPRSRAGLDVKNALALAEASALYFLDVKNTFDYEMINEFGKALANHIKDMKSIDIMGLYSSELQKGYLARLMELQEMLRHHINLAE